MLTFACENSNLYVVLDATEVVSRSYCCTQYDQLLNDAIDCLSIFEAVHL